MASSSDSDIYENLFLWVDKDADGTVTKKDMMEVRTCADVGVGGYVMMGRSSSIVTSECEKTISMKMLSLSLDRQIS